MPQIFKPSADTWLRLALLLAFIAPVTSPLIRLAPRCASPGRRAALIRKGSPR
jgi:hypothetical protein